MFPVPSLMFQSYVIDSSTVELIPYSFFRFSWIDSAAVEFSTASYFSILSLERR